MVNQEENMDDWDFDNGVYFLCSFFVWSKDKTRLRVGIPSKADLEKEKLSWVGAPDKEVVIEFSKGNLEKLKRFILDK